MIDNPEQAERLLERLEASLPIPAMVTPGLAAIIRQQSHGSTLPRRCEVQSVFYTGDGGGVVCELDVGSGDRENVFLASITHLVFDPRSPLTRDIAAYQKRRIKGLKRSGSPKATAVTQYCR